ncbi:MAG: hypothetical protein HQK52_12395 [Oligoflexia bacterium]|nr:hypothetical protein [Oligoflexia bacterium]
MQLANLSSVQKLLGEKLSIATSMAPMLATIKNAITAYDNKIGQTKLVTAHTSQPNAVS